MIRRKLLQPGPAPVHRLERPALPNHPPGSSHHPWLAALPDVLGQGKVSRRHPVSGEFRLIHVAPHLFTGWSLVRRGTPRIEMMIYLGLMLIGLALLMFFIKLKDMLTHRELIVNIQTHSYDQHRHKDEYVNLHNPSSESITQERTIMERLLFLPRYATHFGLQACSALAFRLLKITKSILIKARRKIFKHKRRIFTARYYKSYVSGRYDYIYENIFTCKTRIDYYYLKRDWLLGPTAEMTTVPMNPEHAPIFLITVMLPRRRYTKEAFTISVIICKPETLNLDYEELNCELSCASAKFADRRVFSIEEENQATRLYYNLSVEHAGVHVAHLRIIGVFSNREFLILDHKIVIEIMQWNGFTRRQAEIGTVILAVASLISMFVGIVGGLVQVSC